MSWLDKYFRQVAYDLPAGSAAGQLPVWDGANYNAGAVDLSDEDAVSAVLGVSHGGLGNRWFAREPATGTGATVTITCAAPASLVPDTLYEYRITVLADDGTDKAILELTGELLSDGTGNPAGMVQIDDPLVKVRSAGAATWTVTATAGEALRLTANCSGATAGTVWTAIPEFRKAG